MSSTQNVWLTNSSNNASSAIWIWCTCHRCKSWHKYAAYLITDIVSWVTEKYRTNLNVFYLLFCYSTTRYCAYAWFVYENAYLRTFQEQNHKSHTLRMYDRTQGLCTYSCVTKWIQFPVSHNCFEFFDSLKMVSFPYINVSFNILIAPVKWVLNASSTTGITSRPFVCFIFLLNKS